MSAGISFCLVLTTVRVRANMREMKKPIFDRIAVKSIANIIATLSLFSILISVIGYNSFTNAILNQYADSAFRTARIAASVNSSQPLP